MINAGKREERRQPSKLCSWGSNPHTRSKFKLRTIVNKRLYSGSPL